MKDQVDRAGIEAYWGAQNLTRWDATALRDVAAPAISKRLLTDVGLPSPGRDDPYDPAASRRAYVALRGKLKRIDATALADRNSLWSAAMADFRRDLS